MVQALTSLILSGLVAYAMLIAFFALVPRFAAGRSPILAFSLQWLPIVVLALPAIAVAHFGPSWIYEVPFGRTATQDQRTWLIIGGLSLLGISFLVALRSSAAKRYSKWRAESPNSSLERTRER
jgi:hypothetical protein